MKEAYNYLLSLGFKYNDYLIVGVSGGPDSMALLHLLLKLKKELNLNIVCAHVNHNVRKESDEEKNFVENFCANNNIIFEYIKLDSCKHSEEILRNKRYEFLKTIIKKYNSKYLLTAHHADDLMETILMRIARGSTIKGYSGFSKEVSQSGYKIIRPLINVTKDDIYTYLKKNKLKYVTDESNFKDEYTRNRYRKYVLPFFKSEDSNVHKKFYKFSKTLLEYNEYITNDVKKVLKKVYPERVLNIEEFNKQPYLIKTRIIQYMLEEIYNNDLTKIDDNHVELILDLINSDKNKTIHLPNDIKVIKEYGNVTLIKNSNFMPYEFEFDEHINLLNGKNIEVVKFSESDSNYVCRLDKDEVKFPLYVRSRRNGDKISVKGMLGSKKINDIFIDSKIPSKEREMWPIVTDSNGVIVWLPGLKKSKFDKTKTQKYDIILRYY